jgi:hypothetical protein
MFKHWLAMVLLVSLTGCDHDDEVVEIAPCEQMRDHLIDLQLAESNSIDREAHREILKRSLGETFVSSCESSMSSSQVGCVLHADDSESASACTSSVAGAP